MIVHAIETGSALIRQRQLIGKGHGTARVLRTLADRQWAEPVPIRAWLIEHPEGLILIDTGETARAAQPGYHPRWHPYWRRAIREHVRPDEELAPRLRALGVSPADIRWVVLTHLHADHTGGLESVLGREIIASETEMRFAAGRRGVLRGYLPHRWPAGFAPRLITLPDEPYGPFPRSLRLTRAGDVILVDTAGHTPGHISVVLEREGGPRVFFAGDAAYSEQLLLRGVPDGVAPDERQALRTFACMRQFVIERPTVVLPTHDRDAVARLKTAFARDTTAVALRSAERT